MSVSKKALEVFLLNLNPSGLTEEDVRVYEKALDAAIGAQSEFEMDIVRQMLGMPEMTAECIGLTSCTTILDCIRRPDLKEATELFADLSDLNITEHEAWGEGEIPNSATRLYTIGREARKIVESWR